MAHSTRKNKRRKIQTGGFLSRYDFAYAGRGSVNQAAKHLEKIAPRLIRQTIAGTNTHARAIARNSINQASDRLDSIAQRRIRQAIFQSGDTIERIAPKTIRGAIEEFYKTPFRLLGSFDKRKLAQLKRKIIGRLR